MGVQQEDLVGKQFGEWTVVRFEHSKSIGRHKVPYWNCRCTCGIEQLVHGYHLRAGDTKKCRECASKGRRKYNETHKFCPKCGQWLELDEFSDCKKSGGGKYGHCKICDQTKRHGVTRQFYERLLLEQGGKCAIPDCVEPPTQLDHDHGCCANKKSCGRCIRGILCGKHNLALGLFQDDPKELHKAIEYVLKTKERCTP